MQVTARQSFVAAAVTAAGATLIIGLTTLTVQESSPAPPPPMLGHEPSPNAGRSRSSETIGPRLVIGADGHDQFYERVQFTGPNGKPAEWKCLIDTGAASLVINREQARQLGFNPDRLDYSIVTSTANGRSTQAPITLKSVSIGGQFAKRNAPAAVAAGNLETCIVGMAFLKFFRVVMADGSMELTW